jgi:large subunit ribosomal protein L30
MSKSNKLAVTLVRSPIGRQPSHKATLAGLGLRRIRQTVEVNDTPSVRGMLDKISYMLSVQQVNN